MKENVVGSCGHGVFAGENSIVEGNSMDGGAGQSSITVGNGSIVTGQVAGSNDAGIQAGTWCLVREHTVRKTGFFGIGA